jgi:CRISPR-associated protein Csb1
LTWSWIKEKEGRIAMKTLTLDDLTNAVAGGAAAIRAVTRLEPAGGPGDKIFPPTYMKEGQSLTRYAMEQRRVDGRDVNTVLLDSVASQANRMEEALLEGWRAKELHFPVVWVDFSKTEGLSDLEQISALQAPHRIADALLRDSEIAGKRFRDTDVGRAFTDARASNATGMYKHCPTALVFGVWDSTGPKGGLGSKFQRCLVSEIIGIDVVTGVKTASRIDPAAIEKVAVFKAKDGADEWTANPKEALVEKGKPVELGVGKKKGTPAALNHGNIPPTIDSESGGVTMAYAQQTVVLSLAGLRRLRFASTVEGTPISDEKRADARAAACTALAALALAAIVYQRENDYDLRSRALLVAKEPLVFELLGRDGGEAAKFQLDRQSAARLLKDAHARAADFGLGWQRGPVELQPSKKLADLIRQSRAAKLSEAADPEA